MVLPRTFWHALFRFQPCLQLGRGCELCSASGLWGKRRAQTRRLRPRRPPLPWIIPAASSFPAPWSSQAQRAQPILPEEIPSTPPSGLWGEVHVSTPPSGLWGEANVSLTWYKTPHSLTPDSLASLWYPLAPATPVLPTAFPVPPPPTALRSHSKAPPVRCFLYSPLLPAATVLRTRCTC